MSISSVTTENDLDPSKRRVVRRNTREFRYHTTTMAKLTAALAREKELRRRNNALLHRQELLAQEFEHRLVNGLQLIVSLLSLQSRTAPTVEAASQLTIAATRVAAFGRVHRRLHLLDHRKSVEFRQYLQDLCDDLSVLLFQDDAGRAVVVAGEGVNLPTVLAIPFGFIVNELMTNSMKYAKGNITVRIESSAGAYSLSVADEGPGLPTEFDPAGSKGLGMKIVQSLVKQIGGTLQFGLGDAGHGTRITVAVAPQHVTGLSRRW
jgi:two-component sensor histidine kinase